MPRFLPKHSWFFIWLIAIFVPGFALAQVNSNVIEAAKKERQVVYYTTMTLIKVSRRWISSRKSIHFSKSLSSEPAEGPLLNKITTEARGGRYDWDLVVGRERW